MVFQLSQQDKVVTYAPAAAYIVKNLVEHNFNSAEIVTYRRTVTYAWKKMMVHADRIQVTLENFLHNFCTILKAWILDTSEKPH